MMGSPNRGGRESLALRKEVGVDPKLMHPQRPLEKQAKFLDYCAWYGKVETAEQACRVKHSTYLRWRSTYPDFAEQVEDALSWFKGDIRQTMTDAAFTRNEDGSKTIHDVKLLPVLDKAANAADYRPSHQFVQINHYVSAIPDNATEETMLPALGPLEIEVELKELPQLEDEPIRMAEFIEGQPWPPPTRGDA